MPAVWWSMCERLNLPMTKTGIVEALNVSPKGFHEGFLLRTGSKLMRINSRGGASGTLDMRVNPGVRVTAEVEKEESRGEPGHGVFRLVRLLSIDGKPPEAEQSWTWAIRRPH